MSSVGVDIGGTKILVAAETAMGVVTASAKTPRSFPDLLRALEILFSELALSTIDGIGFGIPGVLRTHGPCWTPNAPAIHGINLAKEVHQRWSVPIVIDNDAKMALVAETSDRSSSPADPVVLVAIGTGIGGAIKVGDSIIAGHRGTAGAFGWIRVKTEHGWMAWEDLASGRALDDAARCLGLSSGPDLIATARQGNVESLVAMERWIDNLANGIASIISILDPELVLLTGGVTAHGDWFIKKVREIVAEAASPLTGRTPVELCRYGTDAVARGALEAISRRLRGGAEG